MTAPSTMKINHHQFSLDSHERNRLWDEMKRHPLEYFKNRYQWFSYPEFRHVHPFPLHVDFEASFLCNLECPMCFRPHIPNYKNEGIMDFDKYKGWIDECAENGLYSIRLSWRGESTLHSKLVDMVAYAKQKGIMEVSFITNGSKLRPKYCAQLIEAGLDYITISVDGLESDYNRLRYPLKYEETREKLREFKSARDGANSLFPRIKVQGIWTYIKDAPQKFYNDFKDLADLVSFDPEHDYSNMNIPQDPLFVCQYLWQRITVTWEGLVPICISDWHKSVVIGDLSKESIKDIWLGKTMDGMRQLHLDGKRLNLKCCKACHRVEVPQIGNVVEGKATDKQVEMANERC